MDEIGTFHGQKVYDGVKTNSLDAYRGIQEDGTAMSQRERVFMLIDHSDGVSRQDISRALGLPINSVCGRVHSLIKQGLVCESGNKIDQVTGKKNAILEVL